MFASLRRHGLAAVLLAAVPAWADDTPLPREAVAPLAAQCAACHGPAGRSPGAMPSLRGTDADTLRRRLRAFRDAPPSAAATVMPRLAKGYSDAQIDALAQWFASPREQQP